MSNIQKQHKISPAIAWLTIQKFIIFYCPLDGEHTISPKESSFLCYFTIFKIYLLFNFMSLHINLQICCSKRCSKRFFHVPQCPETLDFTAFLLVDGLHRREQQYIPDCWRVCQKHYQTVDSVANAASWWHTNGKSI